MGVVFGYFEFCPHPTHFVASRPPSTHFLSLFFVSLGVLPPSGMGFLMCSSSFESFVAVADLVPLTGALSCVCSCTHE